MKDQGNNRGCFTQAEELFEEMVLIVRVRGYKKKYLSMHL